jgi:prepilin-type N-terminal cleavage/methylation domain-containing protein
MDVVTNRDEDRSQHGYSLLETLVALVIFGFALLVAANALTAHAQMAKRLQVRQDLVRSAETVIESVRGGLIPLASGAVDLGDEFLPPSGTEVYAFVAVEAKGPVGLYEVEARTWMHLMGDQVTVTVRTMVWRP